MFRGRTLATAAVLIAVSLTGCHQKMGRQPAYDPYEPSEVFANGSSARPLVEGTIARGKLRDKSLLFTGKNGEQLADAFPTEVTAQMLDRGQERYNIYCSMCHGETGEGDGMIVRRGYKKPPSFHTDDMKQKPAGYYFTVITDGFGVMPSYASQVRVEDRWAIVAYVRALQLSQSATVMDVPPAELSKLEAAGSETK